MNAASTDALARALFDDEPQPANQDDEGTQQSNAMTETEIKRQELIRANRERALMKLAARKAEREEAKRRVQREAEEKRVAALIAEAGPLFTD